MREEVVNFVEALKKVQDQHGAENTFAHIAALWSGYLDLQITSHDVAMMMCLLKIARTKGDSYKLSLDTYVDLANYANFGFDLAWEENNESNC